MKLLEKMKEKKNSEKKISKTQEKDTLIRISIYLLISLLLAGVFFYTTRNILYSLLLLMLCVAFFFLLIERMYKKYSVLDIKTHECIKFINNFIITLSINNSLLTTFEQVEESLKGELKEQVKALSNLTPEEKLEYLKDYFNLNIYEVFLKLMNQYIFNGGDILKISQLLLFDSRKLENSLDNYKSISTRKMIEFISLWGLTVLILVVIQLALNMFYDTILSLPFFTPCIFAFFIILLFFLFMFLKGKFDISFINEIKEEKNVK